MSENYDDASSGVAIPPEQPIVDFDDSSTGNSLQAEETKSDDVSEVENSEQENINVFEPTLDKEAPEIPFEPVENLKTEIAESSDRTPEILSSIRENRTLLERLKAEFETKFKYDQNKEALIDRLYKENREYKNDLLWFLKKDLIAEVVAEIDDMEKRLPYLRQKGATSEDYEKYIEEIAENFRRLLEQNDVYSYRSEEGAPFEPGRQQTLENKTTDDKALDRTIIPVRRGFELNVDGKKRLVRKELVYVYKYDERLAKASMEVSPEVLKETNGASINTNSESSTPKPVPDESLEPETDANREQ